MPRARPSRAVSSAANAAVAGSPVAVFFIESATTGTSALSLHDALPILPTAAPVYGSQSRTAASPPPDASKIGRATSELQSLAYLVCRLLLEKKNDSRC